MQALLRDLDSARANLEPGPRRFPSGPRTTTARASSPTRTSSARAPRWPPARRRSRPPRRRVEQARATLEGAQDTLAKTTVRAPMDGIVTAKRVEEGEVAVIGVQNSPGTVLLTISDMSVVEAEMEVDETSIPRVRAGPGGRGPHRRLPEPTFSGVVTEVGQQPDRPSTGPQNEAIKFKVKVQIEDPPARHQAGPLGPGRHPHRLPQPGAGGADPGAGGARHRARAGRGGPSRASRATRKACT